MNFLFPSLFFFLFLSLFFPLLNCVCVQSQVLCLLCPVVFIVVIITITNSVPLNESLWAGSVHVCWNGPRCVLQRQHSPWSLGNVLMAPVSAVKWVLLKPFSPWKGTHSYTIAVHPDPSPHTLPPSRWLSAKTKPHCVLHAAHTLHFASPNVILGFPPTSSPEFSLRSGLLESPLSLARQCEDPGLKASSALCSHSSVVLGPPEDLWGPGWLLLQRKRHFACSFLLSF